MTATAASTQASATPPADRDRRFYAFVLDRAAGWTLVALAAVPAYLLFIADGRTWTGIGVLVGALLIVGLASALLLGLRGTSPGQAALGLRTVDPGTGAPIGVGPALLRTLVLGAATLPTLGIGAAMLAWTALTDPDRRGWHDRLTGSVVVDVRPPVEQAEVVEEAPRHIVNLTAARLAPAPQPSPQPSAAAPPQSASAQPAPAPAGRPAGEGGSLGSPLRPPPEPAGRWRVSVDTGETFEVEGPTLLGRRPEPRDGESVRRLVRLSSTDMSVSKTHAQLQVAPDGALVVTDRGSTNGSVLIRGGVSRTLPAGAPTTLLPGDRLCLGDRRMTIAREG